jgi:hypothetical protein
MHHEPYVLLKNQVSMILMRGILSKLFANIHLRKEIRYADTRLFNH